MHSYTEELKFCLHWRKSSLHYRCSHTVFEKQGNGTVFPSLLGHCVLLLRLKDVLRALLQSKLEETHDNSSFACITIVADDIKSNSIRTEKSFQSIQSLLNPKAPESLCQFLWISRGRQCTLRFSWKKYLDSNVRLPQDKAQIIPRLLSTGLNTCAVASRV